MRESEPGILNKEAIAARMFRNAARYWGYNDTDIDNFDPLVRLLIEACAVEMYRISNEIHSVQERMLEKLARLLTPEVYTAPRPAHTIMHARSTEAESRVHKRMQFFYHKKIASKLNGPLDSNLDVFFSPAGKYSVTDADIKMIASGSHVYTMNELQSKEVFLTPKSKNKFDSKTLWIGIEYKKIPQDISGLSFFFDLKNHANKSALFPLIHYVKLSFQDELLPTEEGLWDADTKAPVLESYEGFDEFDINQTIERQINRFYKNQFVTVKRTPEKKLIKERYPSSFENIFSENELAQFQKELVWLKAVFLPDFDESVLDDLTVSINCFPVMNRHLNEIRYRLQNNFNIIPLLSEEQFLSVYSVQGSFGSSDAENTYTNSPFDDIKEMQMNGTYSLTTGEVERFDNRNAVEYMNYLLELLRDESRAFAAIGQDFVASVIKELNQNIALIEQKVKQNISLLSQSLTYLLVNPRVEGDHIFVEYWTTNGEMANMIRSGTKLELYEGVDLLRDSIVLLTTTTGGADKLKNTEVLNVYKNTLISKGRIVTPEDVKSFCNMELAGKIKSLRVEKGVHVSILPNEGLINTLDIIIVPAKSFSDKEEWEELCRDLKLKLEEKSAIGVNFRIDLKWN